MTSIFAFVFVLGILVFVHELGHFLAARRIGVRVLTFSLGFGPKLLSFRRGDTEYCISAIPLGGYVKMAGENADEARTGAEDEFLSKSKWQRFQVLVMGPIMNLALAFIVMAIVLYQGAQLPAYEQQPVVIGSVIAGSPAEQAGLKVDDRVIAIDGQPVIDLGIPAERGAAQGQQTHHARRAARRSADRRADHAEGASGSSTRAISASFRRCTRRSRRSTAAKPRRRRDCRPTT